MRAGWFSFGVVGLALTSIPASAEVDSPPPCIAWDIAYELSPILSVTDTTMGGGDGTWKTGPGRVVLRFQDVDGDAGGDATLLDYRERDKLTLRPSTILGSATITSDSLTVGVPNACGVVAEGMRETNKLKWRTPWRVRSAGTLSCNGSLCGVLGAPKAGTHPTETAPHGVTFQSFELGDGLKTIKMGSSVVFSQKDPRSTSHVSFTGKEIERSCVRRAARCP